MKNQNEACKFNNILKKEIEEIAEVATIIGTTEV